MASSRKQGTEKPERPPAASLHGRPALSQSRLSPPFEARSDQLEAEHPAAEAGRDHRHHGLTDHRDELGQEQRQRRGHRDDDQITDCRSAWAPSWSTTRSGRRQLTGQLGVDGLADLVVDRRAERQGQGAEGDDHDQQRDAEHAGARQHLDGGPGRSRPAVGERGDRVGDRRQLADQQRRAAPRTRTDMMNGGIAPSQNSLGRWARMRPPRQQQGCPADRFRDQFAIAQSAGIRATPDRGPLGLSGRPAERRRTRPVGAVSTGSPVARIRVASSPALRALPMATVATGTPLGICTIDSSESIPSRYFSGTGTPITGSGVRAASIPGRWAAPPAPAMITSSPRVWASRP